MSALEKVMAWIATFEKYDILGAFRIDYTDQTPANGGIFPAGLVEVSRTPDIFGRIRVVSQLNFSIYTVFEKAPSDDEGASFNAEWVADFQEWVQEQSVTGLAPVFGDAPKDERIMAQNGVMFDTDDEGTATYMVQLSVQYTKKYEEENPWLT